MYIVRTMKRDNEKMYVLLTSKRKYEEFVVIEEPTTTLRSLSPITKPQYKLYVSNEITTEGIDIHRDEKPPSKKDPVSLHPHKTATQPRIPVASTVSNAILTSSDVQQHKSPEQCQKQNTSTATTFLRRFLTLADFNCLTTSWFDCILVLFKRLR